MILSFLQELLDKGCSPSMLKVYVAAIVASHAPIADQCGGFRLFYEESLSKSWGFDARKIDFIIMITQPRVSAENLLNLCLHTLI